MAIKPVRRGDIYLADLNPVIGSEQGGHRPVLIIQNNRGNHYSPTVIIAAITSRTKAKIPIHVLLKGIDGLEKESVVLMEQIRTIDKKRLEEYIGKVSKNDLKQIDCALQSSVGVPKTRDRPIELCLCRGCAEQFYRIPNHYIRRMDGRQRNKENCMFCNMRKGYDYCIGRKVH